MKDLIPQIKTVTFKNFNSSKDKVDNIKNTHTDTPPPQMTEEDKQKRKSEKKARLLAEKARKTQENAEKARKEQEDAKKQQNLKPAPKPAPEPVPSVTSLPLETIPEKIEKEDLDKKPQISKQKKKKNKQANNTKNNTIKDDDYFNNAIKDLGATKEEKIQKEKVQKEKAIATLEIIKTKLFQQDKDGNTSLHTALKNNNKKETKGLLDNFQKLPHSDKLALLKIKNNQDLSLLCFSTKDEYIVRELLKDLTSQEKKDVLSIQDKGGQSAIYYGVLDNKEGVVQELLKDLTPQEKLELLKIQNINQNTPLHLASTKENTAIIIELLAIQNINQNTPLHVASYKGKTAVIKELLKDLTPQEKLELLSIKRSDGDSTLHCAFASGDLQSVQELLKDIPIDKKLELLRTKNADGVTPLYIATNDEHMQIFQNLLDDINTEYESLQSKKNDMNPPLNYTDQFFNLINRMFKNSLNPNNG